MPENTHRKPHAVVFPYPYQGHVTPTAKLAVKLASAGFTVTFVLPEFIHHTLSKHHGNSNGGSAAADIRCATISDGFPIEFDRDANFVEYWESMIADLPDRVDEVVRGIKESNGPATELFLVADSLYTWPAEIAAKHKLVNVSVWTQTALGLSMVYHLDPLEQNCQDSDVQPLDVNSIVDKILKLAMEQVKRADFILCNTVHELEPHSLSSLHRSRPTYAVGPINFSAATNPAKTALRPESDCSEWLESKPPNSVLYISLGSIFEFNEEQIKDIAYALLSTRVSFIWVLKNTSGAYAEILPNGFMDDVGEIGLVVPWCNQNLVLSNDAIGGFLTHCGWNSILESMWNGVPMLCYPFTVDQPRNRKLVVEEWKIGIDLCDGGGVKREEVSRKIEGLMKGETCIELRQEAKNVKEIVRNALEREGSSERNFDRFVSDLKGRLHEDN